MGLTAIPIGLAAELVVSVTVDGESAVSPILLLFGGGMIIPLGPLFVGGELAFEQLNILRLAGGIGLAF